MKRIVLFGAGKSATGLIDYLIRESAGHDWEFTVADGNLAAAQSKIQGSQKAKAIQIDVENETERNALIRDASIVISLLPPSFHFLVAQDCIKFGKNLLTASYLDDKIRGLRRAIEEKNILFICEMGLDPGIDHMSAMEIIRRVQGAGGQIHSFRSHTGGLVAPESDDNPWHYKISWNPRNVVMAGSAGAVYKEHGIVKSVPYEKIFDDCREVTIPGLESLAFYPNRDSLSYIPVYGLESASTFIRTTLRYPSFCANWKLIVKAGLTNDQQILRTGPLRFSDWSAPLHPFLTKENESYFSWLGLLNDALVPASAKTSADILQWLLETKMVMKPLDKDMIVMLHEIDYELANKKHFLKSSLIVKGENSVRTAMAKTVGLPLGIATKLILQDEIKLTGLHIPIREEIYQPVLKELARNGISFEEWTN
jgi:saccharopine dehydrogenase-like NADP-dependent oxidoreductase